MGPLDVRAPPLNPWLIIHFCHQVLTPQEDIPLPQLDCSFLLTHLRTVRNVGCTSLDTHYFGLGNYLRLCLAIKFSICTPADGETGPIHIPTASEPP